MMQAPVPRRASLPSGEWRQGLPAVLAGGGAFAVSLGSVGPRRWASIHATSAPTGLLLHGSHTNHPAKEAPLPQITNGLLRWSVELILGPGSFPQTPARRSVPRKYTCVTALMACVLLIGMDGHMGVVPRVTRLQSAGLGVPGPETTPPRCLAELQENPTWDVGVRSAL